jgi:hypothetical protein
MLYLGYFKPYSEKIITLTNIFTEFIICCIILIILLINVYNNDSIIGYIDQIFVGMIYAIFAAQTFAPILIMMKKLYAKLFGLLRKNQVIPINSDNEPPTDKVIVLSRDTEDKSFTIVKSES